MAINLVCADISENVDSLSGVRVFFNVEGKDVLKSNMSFPNVGVPLHLPDTK